MNVVLNFVDHCIELVSAVNNFNLENCSFLRIHSCVNKLVLIILSCVECVNCVTKACLIQENLVLNISLKIGYDSCFIKYRKLDCVACFNGSTVSCLNCSCELVLNFCIISIRKVNGPEVCLGAFNNLNSCVVNCPSYVELCSSESKYSQNIIVVGKCLTVFGLHLAIEKFFCFSECSSFGCVCRLLGLRLSVFAITVTTSNKNTQAHDECKEKC